MVLADISEEKPLQEGGTGEIRSLNPQESTCLVPRTGRGKQYAGAIVVNMIGLTFGLSVGWTSQDSLLSQENPFGEPLTKDQLGWLGSLTFMGGIAGCLLWGKLADRLGRRSAALLTSIPAILGWALIVFSSHIYIVYLARLCQGFGGSVAFIIPPLYVSEIADDTTRGPLSSYVIMFFNIGILLSYIVGSVLSYRFFSAVCLAVPMIFVGIFFFFPETPVFLLSKKEGKRAERALLWFRGGNMKIVQEELEKLSKVEKKEDSSSWRNLVGSRANRRALEIGTGLFWGQQLCGVLVLLSFTADIFKESGSTMSRSLSVITVGAIQLTASYLGSILVSRSGRKVLLLFSFGAMGTALLALGAFFKAREEGVDLSCYNWVPVACLSLHVFTYALGVGPVPYVVLSEILSSDIRGRAMSVLVFWGTCFAFASVKLYPILTEGLGNHGCYWFFSFWCWFSFVFTLLRVPETKGTVLQEVIDKFNRVSAQRKLSSENSKV